MAKRPPIAVLVLAVLGGGSVLWGVALSLQGPPVSTPTGVAVTPTQTAQPSSKPPGVGPTQTGSGTWKEDAPTTTQTATTQALCPDCDVVVITMCSLRRDHVSAYGPTAGVNLTPRLDALMDGAFRMDQAWAASNFTLAGLTAVLTGRFGSTTGVTGWDKGLVKDVPTLPEVLGVYGYRTGAFTIDAPSGFRPDYGLDRGFQHMEIIPPPRDTPDGRTREGEVGPGGDSARPAAAWIAAQDKSQPLLAMFHTRTAHYPFVLENDPDDPTGITQLLWDSGSISSKGQAMPGTAGGTAQRGVVQIAGPDPVQVGVRKAGAAGVAVWKKLYAESVRRMDLDIGVMADALAARGRLDKTVIIVLADHGESLDDHGELLHGDAYFDGVVHIPMLVKVPGGKGGPVSALASQVDVLPTLLDLVGAVVPAGIDGASMVPLFTGTAASIRTTALIEGGVSWRDDAKHPRGAVIAPPWALLRQDRGCGGTGESARGPGEPASCLYNLLADPGQEKNVAAANKEVVTDLLGRWDKFRAARAGEAATLILDPKYIEELQRTGYDFRPGSK